MQPRNQNQHGIGTSAKPWRSSIQSVTADEFHAVSMAQRLIVLYLWAGWDNPGRIFDTWLSDLLPSVSDRLAIYGVDVDSELGLEVTARFQVQTTPTLLFLSRSTLQGRLKGSENQIELEDHLRAWVEVVTDLP